MIQCMYVCKPNIDYNYPGPDVYNIQHCQHNIKK